MSGDKTPEEATANEQAMARLLHDRFVDLAAEHLRYLLDSTEASAALFATERDWATVLRDRLCGEAPL